MQVSPMVTEDGMAVVLIKIQHSCGEVEWPITVDAGASLKADEAVLNVFTSGLEQISARVEATLPPLPTAQTLVIDGLRKAQRMATAYRAEAGMPPLA